MRWEVVQKGAAPFTIGQIKLYNLTKPNLTYVIASAEVTTNKTYSNFTRFMPFPNKLYTNEIYICTNEIQFCRSEMKINITKVKFKFARNAKIYFRNMRYISHWTDLYEKRTFIDKMLLKYNLHEKLDVIIYLIFL